MSNERRLRELAVLEAADALVARWGDHRASRAPLRGPEVAVLSAVRALRSFEDDEAVAEAAYEEAMIDLHNRAGRLEDRVSYERVESIERRLAEVEERLRPPWSQHVWPQPDVLPPGGGDDRLWVTLTPGEVVALPPTASLGALPTRAQLPHGPEGVVAVDELALRALCLALAKSRNAGWDLGSWRGDREEVRLVWDEFLSGHDARLLP